MSDDYSQTAEEDMSDDYTDNYPLRFHRVRGASAEMNGVWSCIVAGMGEGCAVPGDFEIVVGDERLAMVNGKLMLNGVDAVIEGANEFVEQTTEEP